MCSNFLINFFPNRSTQPLQIYRPMTGKSRQRSLPEIPTACTRKCQRIFTLSQSETRIALSGRSSTVGNFGRARKEVRVRLTLLEYKTNPRHVRQTLGRTSSVFLSGQLAIFTCLFRRQSICTGKFFGKGESGWQQPAAPPHLLFLVPFLSHTPLEHDPPPPPQFSPPPPQVGWSILLCGPSQ